MTSAQGLALVRAVHTAIYLVMVAAILAVLWAGVSGRHGAWLWIATALVVAESAVFALSGMKCPLTAVAARYHDGQGVLSDTFLPERFTRHTLHIFGPLLAAGLLAVAARGGLHAWVGG